MPTIVGDFVFDFLMNNGALGQDVWTLIIIGLVSSFIAGFFVVRSLLDYVSKHGFALFGWWRIIVGGLGLLGLILTQS